MSNKPKYNKHLPFLLATSMVAAGCATVAEKEQQPPADDTATQQNTTVVAKSEPIIQSDNSSNNPLLPTAAKAGECYARVWKEPTYRTFDEKVLVRAQSEALKIQPAQYVTVEEKVMLTPETTKLVAKPAVYKTVTEKVLVSEAEKAWRVQASPRAAFAPKDIVERAGKNGVELASAEPNMCFHEHFLSSDYAIEQEKVLVKEASEKIVSKPATYRTVEKKVMIKEASSKIVVVPAVYETVEEKVVDKPAHQTWKKGTGAIQKIDESTGEIMCLVDVPATYKTVKKQVLKTPETTKVVEIPAEYTTVKVQELVEPAKEERVEVPAEYQNVAKKKVVGEQRYVWHEITSKELTKETRTGNQICLVDTPAKYKTVTKRVVVEPATTEVVKVPATYKTVSVQKLAKAANTQSELIPAEYKVVQRNEQLEEGKMEWRSILCETNMTHNRVSDIQQALVDKGYDPGKIDGIVGKNTMAAVNAFQRDNNLPVDEYLNIDTVQALDVSTQ